MSNLWTRREQYPMPQSSTGVYCARISRTGRTEAALGVSGRVLQTGLALAPGGPGQASGHRRSIVCADDRLVPVDDRSGDNAGASRQQEDHEVRNFVRLAELAHRL